NPDDARSTPYATDVAKMIEAPILHVNADDPEAVIYTARLALEYRMTFNKDVVIDLVCYRRHGHNEADEPSATQPAMYKIIKAHKTTRELYAEALQQRGAVDEATVKKMMDDYREGLDEGRTVAPATLGLIGNEYTADWTKFEQNGLDEKTDTSIAADRIRMLGDAITTVPEDFELHGRVKKIVDDRKKMADGEMPMDWGFAETMAYAALLTDRFSVRLTGQDAGRGTFFHRHAVLHNQKDRSVFIPLGTLAEENARFTIVDSLLSEEAVVGFEYGYSTADPNTLVIWEAQFGDFANGAQVVVDQFLAAGEAKWGRLCGLTLFLPHGYEGQGPEHSSARLERYLQLCAQHNMRVCVPTTPAQMFHMLRRQMMSPLRKPLIVMTPKSLLRHKLSVSPLEDLEKGRFHHVIPEIDELDPKNVRTVVFCSGKVYYDLLESRRADERNEVAIVRIEQLYPFPEAEYEEQLAKYSNANDIVWCQEEPMNQGAWYQIRHRLHGGLQPRHDLRYAGREHAASTAAGYFQMHVAEQKALIADALDGGAHHGNSRKKKTGTEKA
ncbi:MAG TPA: 2-oxoglutarate dehydrogenase E1 component, partial [Gammaproteobacteria bacterium]